MKIKTINVYADSGHAWAKVKTASLIKLGISDNISSFSYQRNDYTYLEEDCDLNIYVNKLKENNIEFKFKEYHTNKQSKIRSYNTYKSLTNIT